MASAGTVTIDFAAETAKFTAELKKVQSSLKSLETGFGAMGDFVKQAQAQFSGLVSVGALTSLAVQAFNAADEIVDAAARAGVAVDSLSRLAFAANQSDVEFGSLTAGIKNLQRSLVEATAGTGDAAAAFKRIGVNAADLRGLKLEQQLGKIADGFQKILDPAERTALATQIFVKAGGDLVPLLAGGSQAIAQLTQEADRLGVTLTTQTAAGISATDYALKLLKASVNGFFASRIGGIALAIYGTDGLDKITKLQLDIEHLRQEKERIELSGAPAGSGFAARLKEIGKELDILQPKLDKLQAAQARQDAINAVTQVADAKMRALFAKADIGFAKLQTKINDEADAKAKKNEELDRELESLKLTRNARRAAEVERIEARRREHALLAEVDREGLLERETQEIEFLSRNLQFQSDFSALLQQVRKNLGIQEINWEQIKSQSILEIATQLFVGMSGISKTFAKVQQGIALAQAVWYTATGVANALRSVPFPANLVAAAKVAAFGAVQIAKIKSTSFDNPSGSIAIGGGGAGGSGALNKTDVGETVATGATTKAGTTIYISGFISRNTIDDLVTALRDEVDRDVTLFGSNSRQAFDTVGAG